MNELKMLPCSMNWVIARNGPKFWRIVLPSEARPRWSPIGMSRSCSRSSLRPGRAASGCDAACAAGGLSGRLHGGEQEGDQDRDDRDHDQELESG